MNKKIISLKNICYKYPQGLPIFENLSLNLFEGDKIGLLAPNGSGKTTLFNMIMGLEKPDSGEIKIFNKTIKQEKEFKKIRKSIGLLFQNSDDQLFCPTVIDDVAFGPLNLGKTNIESINIAYSTLKFLEIEHLANRITHKLSGGEKRMVALATILSMKPKVLLLDEPSTGLDKKTKKNLINILNKLDKTLFIVSHEFDLLTKITQNIITIQNKTIVLDSIVYSHIHEHKHEVGYYPHEHTF